MDAQTPPVTLRCRSCGAPFAAESLAPDFADCRHCGGIQAMPARDVRRPEAPRTERFRLETTPGGIRIRYHWISPAGWFFALVGVLLIPPTAILFFFARTEHKPAAAVVGVGFGAFTVIALSRLAVRTIIEVQRGELSWRRSPLSLSREVYFKAAAIHQLASSQETHVTGQRGETQYRTYGVSVILKDGRRLKLVGHLPEAADALFLEQQIEKALGLADRPVGGELPR